MSTAASHANAPAESRRLIAPLWHTVVMFIILSVPVVIGAALQTRAAGAQLLSNHSQAMLRFYVPAIIFEWLLVLYVWFGVRKQGGTVASLIGANLARRAQDRD